MVVSVLMGAGYDIAGIETAIVMYDRYELGDTTVVDMRRNYTLTGPGGGKPNADRSSVGPHGGN